MSQKNREFLNCFWDLAVNDSGTRISAVEKLLEFIEKSDDRSVDIEYTAKRLIRGISSSREAARQGFASCLTQLLSLGIIDVDYVIEGIKETTKITGSLKRGEERDYMLGKLFGCLVIMRASIEMKKEHIEFIMESLSFLNSWKGWMKEVVTESILYLISETSYENFNEIIFPVIQTNLQTSIADMAAWQVALFTGLQLLSNLEPKIKNNIDMLHHDDLNFNESTFELLVPTLTSATSGYPKIHRIWNNILCFIFPHTKHREIVGLRCDTISSHQESILKSFMSFIDKHLIVPSNEKRGVAYAIVAELVKYCPSYLLPACLSKRVVRSITNACGNKKHILHSIAESTIKSIVASAGDNKVKVAMASVLIRYGGANFDSTTKTSTIQSLLEGLSQEDIMAHIEVLCSMIGENMKIYHDHVSQISETKNQFSESIPNMEILGADSLENAEEIVKHSISTVQQAIENLITLSKNTKIQGRFNINVIVTAVLVRIVDVHKVLTKKKIQKVGHLLKYMKKMYEHNSSDDENLIKHETDWHNDHKSEMSEYVGILSHKIFGTRDETVKHLIPQLFKCIELVELGVCSYPSEVLSFANTKLLSHLTDIESKSFTQISNSAILDQSMAIHSMNKSNGARMKPQKKSENDLYIDYSTETNSQIQTNNFLQISMNILMLFLENGYIINSREEGNPDDSDNLDLKQIIEYNYNIQKMVIKELLSLKSSKSSSRSKLLENIIAFISLSTFHVLGSESDKTALEDIGVICKELVFSTEDRNMDADEHKEEEESKNASSQSRLFDICMDFLSVSEDQSIKGIRDVIKRVWNSIVENLSIDEEVVDSIMAIVTDEEIPDNEEDEIQEEDEIEEENEVEEEDEVEEDENGEDDNDLAQNRLSINKNNGSRKDIKDILLTQNELVNFLNDDKEDEIEEEDDDDDDLKVILQHEGTPEQDKALADLIKLRKSSRKLGLLRAQKHQFLVRTRAIDFLEIIVRSKKYQNLLINYLVPFLQAIKKLHSSSFIMNIQEARTFEQRLIGLVTTKISSIRINSSDKNEGGNFYDPIVDDEVVKKQLKDIFDYLRSPIASIRQLAMTCFTKLIQEVIDSNALPEIKELLSSLFLEACSDFKSNKNSKFSRKFIDTLFQRHRDYAISTILYSLMDGCHDSKGQYIQTECCEIVTSIIQKFETLSSESQNHVYDYFPQFIWSIMATVKDMTNSNEDKESKEIHLTEVSNVTMKRLKTFWMALNSLSKVIQSRSASSLLKSSVDQIRSYLKKILPSLINSQDTTKKATVQSLYTIGNMILERLSSFDGSTDKNLKLDTEAQRNHKQERKRKLDATHSDNIKSSILDDLVSKNNHELKNVKKLKKRGNPETK